MAQQKPADAVPDSWVNGISPRLQPYMRLARFDRMTGAWLLYWPCAWGALLTGRTATNSARWLILLFIGAVVMRGAGCAYNDIIDRDIDARVARTCGRPLPSGQMNVRQAWGFIILLCLLGLGVLLQLPRFAQMVALGSIPLVAAYPFMKRITWWPQLWLGLAFNWGTLVGYAAVSGTLDVPAYLLYGAGIAWTLGYDTIYALQDIEDDALAGVKSSARAAGRYALPLIATAYSVMFILFGSAIFLAGKNNLILLPALIFTVIKGRQARTITTKTALQLFRSNVPLGFLINLGLLLVST